MNVAETIRRAGDATNEGTGMQGIMFTLIPIFIGGVALFVFGGILMTFVTNIRRGRMIHQRTDEIFRQTRARNSAAPSEPEAQRRQPACKCSHCGASLGADTEISPSGDFKCQYCNSWSNVN